MEKPSRPHETGPMPSGALSVSSFSLTKWWPVGWKPKGLGYSVGEERVWPGICPPFLHLENERVSLIVHREPSNPKLKKIIEKKVLSLFNTYEVIITSEFSFTLVFVSRREAMSYLI